LVRSLVESDNLLLSTNIHHARQADPQGVLPIRHYATCADGSLDMFYSKEYPDQRPISQTWIERNQLLWKYLGDRLKLIFPEAYNKLPNIVLLQSLQLLWYPWAGAAINQAMTPYRTLQHHQDWNDYKSAPNAVVPYGDYQGGDLVLSQAKCIIELRPGDALIFMGSLICHGNTKIISGIRNSVNLFTNKSNIDWIRRYLVTRRKRNGGVAVGKSYAWRKYPEQEQEEEQGKNTPHKMICRK